MVKIGRLDDSFLYIFFAAGKPGRKPITAAKRKVKEKEERGKKFQNSKSLSQNVLEHILVARLQVARTASCRVANAFPDQSEANLAEIPPQNHQNVKKAILAKSSR